MILEKIKLNLKDITQKDVINFLFYLIIISISLGNFIAEFNLFILTLLFLFYFKKEKFNIEFNWIFIFFLLFYSYISVNAFIQIDDNLRLTSYGYIRFIIFSYLIYFFLKRNLLLSKKMFLILVLFFISIICDSIFQFFLGKNILNFELIGDRVSGIFGDELILGSFSLKSSLIILSLIFVNKINIVDHKLKMIFIFFLTFVSIYIAAERTAFIMMIVAVTLLFILLQDLRNILKKSILLFIFFIALVSNFDLGQKQIQTQC